jgi:hypothetical protein
MKIKREFITNLNAAYLFHLSPITFEHNPRAHSALPRLGISWKKSHSINLDLPFATIHKQPFTIHYDCGIADFELWLVGFPSSFPPHLSLMCYADRCDFSHGCPFDNFRTPCTIFWHDTLSLRHHRTPLLIGCGFLRGNMFRPLKPNHASQDKVRTSTVSGTAPGWLLRHLSYVDPAVSYSPYRYVKCLIDTKVAGWETLIFGHASYLPVSVLYTRLQLVRVYILHYVERTTFYWFRRM